MRKLLNDKKLFATILLAIVIFAAVVFSLFPTPKPIEHLQEQTRQATGTLNVHPSNPRYFSDGSGKAIYMVSVYNGKLLHDIYAGEETYDWNSYVNYLMDHNINLSKFVIRDCGTDNREIISPTIYKRTGPGKAADGGLKFDVTQLNQDFFDRLRSRVIDLKNHGIYVVVMFFNGWELKNPGPTEENYWKASPFYRENNINGIDGDINNDETGLELEILPLPSGFEDIQRTRIRKIIDTVNDLDNVIYEVTNEGNSDSGDWQDWVIDEIRSYEANKPKQHLAGRTVEFPGGSNAELFASDADWISPNSKWITGNVEKDDYKNNPPASDGNKIIINDTDHWNPGTITSTQVWKNFVRGIHPMSIEGWDGTFDHNADAHASMEYTRSYAERMNLVEMVPRNDLASTLYCLANPGSEYLIYQPLSSSTFTVNLAAGTYNYEWFNPDSGRIAKTSTLTSDGSSQPFAPPFSGQAVLYLKGIPNLNDYNAINFKVLLLLEKLLLSITPNT